MNLAVLFLEASLGNGIVFLILGIILGIAVIIGFAITILVLIINSFSHKNQPFKYYLFIFLVSSLIGILVSGLVCGSIV